MSAFLNTQHNYHICVDFAVMLQILTFTILLPNIFLTTLFIVLYYLHVPSLLGCFKRKEIESHGIYGALDLTLCVPYTILTNSSGSKNSFRSPGNWKTHPFSLELFFSFQWHRGDCLVSDVRRADSIQWRGKPPTGSHVSPERDKMADRIDTEISQD